MRVRLALAGLLSTACSGGTDLERKEPEICDDGIDNNGDLLIDCDDAQSCGGLVCQGVGDDDDSGVTTEPAADLEIIYDPEDCCDFTFEQSDCPTKSIGKLELVNRTTDVDATFDASCQLVGPQSAIEWQVVGSSSQPVPYLLGGDLFAGVTLEVEGFFGCRPQFDSSFEVLCEVLIEAEGVDDVRVELNVDAEYVGR